MSRKSIPSYRLHRSTGQAVVTIDGHDHYLGRHNTPSSHEQYERLIATWLSNGRSLPEADEEPTTMPTTVGDVMVAYLHHADIYYRDKEGKPTKEVVEIEFSMRPLAKLYAHLPANEFGPKKLKDVRELMIQSGLARTTINNRIQRLKKVFKWATEEELCHASIYHGLRAVVGLKRNRTTAPEPRPVLPVERSEVDVILPLVSRQVAAMIELQWLSGMRPGEVVIMRTMDIDRSGKVWLYRPHRHKTEHHGHDRIVPLGPEAQLVLRRWLRADPSAYLFDPREAEADRNSAKRAARKSPMTPSQRKRRRAKDRRRDWRDCYDTQSYGRTISRACEKAGIARWTPNQLRHSAATRLRKEIGLEAARVVLGHRSAEVTEIYAEIDRTKAIDVMSQHG